MQLKVQPPKKNIFPVLMKLRSNNQNEFRHQIVARLKKITSEKNAKELSDLIKQFKKEFISDFFFYIDYLNNALRNILFKEKANLHHLLNDFIFLAQIGDAFTLELLKKVLGYFENDQQAYKLLKDEVRKLEERVDRLEKRSDDFKLFPMLEIIDHWID